MFNALAGWLVGDILGLDPAGKLGSSLHFFIYDTLKIIVLLSIMIFIISYLRSYFPAEKTKLILSRFQGYRSNVLAALLGIVTPFCSCSSVPLFIGFVEAGIPLGVTFSFLITSPIVNEVALVMLLGMFGLKIAVIYVLAGIIIGVLGGIIIGKLGMEKHVEEYVYRLKMGQTLVDEMSWQDRMIFARENVKEIINRVWLYIVLGIGLGAVIHGYAPEDLLIRWAGPDNPFAVLVAVLLGVPLYANAVGTMPIAEALIGKGVAEGTALAFMMSVTALSAPEMIILRKVIKPRLIAVFVTVTTIAILIVGCLFNMII
ncbi:MAG: permease [Peptococcaceae bacterium]